MRMPDCCERLARRVIESMQFAWSGAALPSLVLLFGADELSVVIVQPLLAHDLTASGRC